MEGGIEKPRKRRPTGPEIPVVTIPKPEPAHEPAHHIEHDTHAESHVEHEDHADAHHAHATHEEHSDAHGEHVHEHVETHDHGHDAHGESHHSHDHDGSHGKSSHHAGHGAHTARPSIKRTFRAEAIAAPTMYRAYRRGRDYGDVMMRRIGVGAGAVVASPFMLLGGVMAALWWLSGKAYAPLEKKLFGGGGKKEKHQDHHDHGGDHGKKHGGGGHGGGHGHH